LENIIHRVYTHTAFLVKCSEDLVQDSLKYFPFPNATKSKY